MLEVAGVAMPLFDFRCEKCQAVFERLVRFDVIPPCPECGSEAVERCVSAPRAPGQSAGLIASARQAAAKQGHFSNYSAADRAKLKR